MNWPQDYRTVIGGWKMNFRNESLLIAGFISKYKVDQLNWEKVNPMIRVTFKMFLFAQILQ